MSTVRVYHDGWVAIPESLRKRLQVESGDLLWISVDKHRLVLSPSPQPAAETADAGHRDGVELDGDGRADGHDGGAKAASDGDGGRRLGARSAGKGRRSAARSPRNGVEKSTRAVSV